MQTQENLIQQASQAFINQDRLIFASHEASFEEHLKRYALADLFLDSFPYNAHVTAADALWAGLPVLTLQGQSFASRVASSILQSLGLPSLVTTTRRDYLIRAVELANQPEQLEALKKQLSQGKARGQYFNQQKYVEKLERALKQVVRKHRTPNK